MTWDIWWTVALGTGVLLLFSVGFVAAVAAMKQKELAAQRKQLEEILLSEEKYRNLFEQSPAGMLRFTEQDWTVFDANRSLLQMFRVKTTSEVRDTLRSMPAHDLEFLTHQLRSDGSVEGYEVLLKREDGSEFWVSISASAVPGRLTEAVIIDTTLRRAVEEKSREQARLLDQAQDAILVHDLRNIVLYWNRGAERLYGWQPFEVIAKNIVEFIYPGGEESYKRAFDATVQNGSWSGEMRHRKRDGSSIETDCRWSLIRDSSGNPKSVLQVCTDVTSRKRLEARFLQAQRVESIGVFASGIAHDLKSALAPVLIGVGLLKRKLRDPNARHLLDSIEESANHGSDLVYQVLSYVKGIEGTYAEIPPGRLVKDILGLIEHLLPPAVTVQTHIDDPLPNIVGDRNQLHRVFMNLCTNALDAMPGGGVLTLSVGVEQIDRETAEEYHTSADRSYVVIGVGDSGVGIPASEIHKIFEPFYTTKEVGKGTGLGLSICQGIVKGHRGFITVESGGRSGTNFRVFLPAAETPRAGSDAVPSRGKSRGVIFIVNSTEDVRQDLLEAFEQDGYEPHIAAGRKQVNEAVLQHLGQDVLVVVDGYARGETDTTMREVQKIEPRARFIILAASSQAAGIMSDSLPQPTAVFDQTATAEALLAAVRNGVPKKKTNGE